MLSTFNRIILSQNLFQIFRKAHIKNVLWKISNCDSFLCTLYYGNTQLWCYCFLNQTTIQHTTPTKIFFKLFEMATSTTCHKDNNKGVHCQFSMTHAWMKTQDYWSTVVTSSQERETNLVAWTKSLVFFTTNSCI